MEKVLTELCAELNNYFWRTKVQGHFVITEGVIHFNNNLPIMEDQYFRIIGSVFNDGVHKYPASDLKDEEFDGAVWSMAVPQAVIDIATDLDAWLKQYGGVDSPAMSPYNSESFNNYSYSKGSTFSGTSGSGNANSWQAVFASRLNKWRRMRGIP